MSDQLNTGIVTRIDEFGESMLSHPKLANAFTQVFSEVKRPTVSIVEVMGPTGVGKTTLVNKLYRESLNFFSPKMAGNPGLVPVIKVEAAAPENGMFQWLDLFQRILRELREPMIECKTLPPAFAVGMENPQKKSTINAMRWAVEQAIRFRGTSVIIIDEAQHLTKTPNARRLADQMDVIKSLATQTNAQFVMTGTYELRLLLNQNGQLARRIRSVHFGRYNYANEHERQEFINILGMFESRLPLAGNNLLTSQPEFIYKNCLGCVGILKEWLRTAVERAAQAGRNHFLKGDLAATPLPPASLEKIFEEIGEGEQAVANQMREASDWTLKLGLPNTATANATPAKSVNRPVGQRKPQRDPVGVPYVEHIFSGSH